MFAFSSLERLSVRSLPFVLLFFSLVSWTMTNIIELRGSRFACLPPDEHKEIASYIDAVCSQGWSVRMFSVPKVIGTHLRPNRHSDVITNKIDAFLLAVRQMPLFCAYIAAIVLSPLLVNDLLERLLRMTCPPSATAPHIINAEGAIIYLVVFFLSKLAAIICYVAGINTMATYTSRMLTLPASTLSELLRAITGGLDRLPARPLGRDSRLLCEFEVRDSNNLQPATAFCSIRNSADIETALMILLLTFLCLLVVMCYLTVGLALQIILMIAPQTRALFLKNFYRDHPMGLGLDGMKATVAQQLKCDSGYQTSGTSI